MMGGGGGPGKLHVGEVLPLSTCIDQADYHKMLRWSIKNPFPLYGGGHFLPAIS